jgi:hypothetical protein
VAWQRPLVVGVLGLIAAGLAAWFAYPSWKASRAKAELHVAARLHSHSRPSGQRSVSMYVTIRNDGDAPAIGWGVMLLHDRVKMGSFGSPPGRFSSGDHHRGTVLAWAADGADDTIEPGHGLKLGVGLPNYTDERLDLRDIWMPEDWKRIAEAYRSSGLRGKTSREYGRKTPWDHTDAPLSDVGDRVVVVLGEPAARELLEALERSDAGRAALTGRLHLRDDAAWLAELLIDLEDDVGEKIARVRLVEELRRTLER